MKQYTTKDGHRVRSRAEVIIDNLLFELGITHDYEKSMTIMGTTLRPDWFLPDSNAIIEFWGMEDHQEYVQKQVTKLKLYAEHNLPCLSLNDDDLEDSRRLEEKLSNFAKKHAKAGVGLIEEPVLSGPISPSILVDLRRGRRCYFCKQKKKPAENEPLCTSCYETDCFQASGLSGDHPESPTTVLLKNHNKKANVPLRAALSSRHP